MLKSLPKMQIKIVAISVRAMKMPIMALSSFSTALCPEYLLHHGSEG